MVIPSHRHLEFGDAECGDELPVLFGLKFCCGDDPTLSA